MGLLSGDGATLLNSVFSPLYLNGRIFKTQIVYDAYGELTKTFAEYDAKVQVDSMTESMRGQEGAADDDRRILVLTQSTSAPMDSDCEIICDEGPYQGVMFRVATVSSDPLGSYWEIRGRRAA